MQQWHCQTNNLHLTCFRCHMRWCRKLCYEEDHRMPWNGEQQKGPSVWGGVSNTAPAHSSFHRRGIYSQILVIKQWKQGRDFNRHQRRLMQNKSYERKTVPLKKSSYSTPLYYRQRWLVAWGLGLCSMSLLLSFCCFLYNGCDCCHANCLQHEIYILSCAQVSRVIRDAVIGGVLLVQCMSLWKMRDESLPLWAGMTNRLSFGSNDVVKLPHQRLGTQGIITSNQLSADYMM